MKFKKELGFVTTPLRSALMQRIRSKHTKIEIMFRKALWKEGIRYRINYKGLPGSPDIVIKKNMLIVFVDGVFWHRFVDLDGCRPLFPAELDYKVFYDQQVSELTFKAVL